MYVGQKSPQFELLETQINGYQGWDEILMITLISSKNLGGYKIIRNTLALFYYGLPFF